MRCSKVISTILLVCFYSLALWAQDNQKLESITQSPSEKVEIVYPNKIIPYEDNVLKVGERIWVAVKTDKKYEELKKLVGTKINQIIFLSEIKEEENQFLFEVIPLEYPKKRDAKKNKFELIGFKYEGLKGQKTQEFIVLDKNYKITEDDNDKGFGFLWIIGAIVVILLVYFVPYIKGRLHRKKQIEKKVLELKDILANTNSRADLEKIFEHRKEIATYLELNSEFDKFLEKIDEIQYKKNWEDEDLREIKNIANKIEIEGISNGV